MARELTRLERQGGIATISLDNPPVNALGTALVAALLAQIEADEASPETLAVVIRGANGTFSAGADIHGLAGSAEGPTLRDVIAAIERSEKPFVAARLPHRAPRDVARPTRGSSSG